MQENDPMVDKESSVLSRVAQTIATYDLVGRGNRVLVGFSGGPDSTALLHILCRLSKKIGITLGALYINHRLRPRAAIAEARFCEETCGSLSIPFHFEEVDIGDLAEKERAGIEETARKYRYLIYTRLAQQESYDFIAVGHNRDDRVETILFNLFRGSGRLGVAGMPPKRGLFIRPLYDISREEIVIWLKQNGLNYMTDRSNFSRQFTRNRIRHQIIPLIEKEITSAAADNIIRFSEIMADEEEYLDEKIAKLFRRLASETPGGKFKLDLTGLLEYDVWFLRRLVRKLLNRAGLFEIAFAEIERVIELIRSDKSSRISITGNKIAEKCGPVLFLYGPGQKIERREVTIPGRYHLHYPKVSITLEYVGGADVNKIKRSSRIAYVDAGKLSGQLYIAGPGRGDRFRPYGRPGSKKVGDFLTDLKYPRPLRDELPVLHDGRGIVWVAGVEIDARVKIDRQTKQMVKLEIKGS